jgi:hypothetical protein
VQLPIDGDDETASGSYRELFWKVIALFACLSLVTRDA